MFSDVRLVPCDEFSQWHVRIFIKEKTRIVTQVVKQRVSFFHPVARCFHLSLSVLTLICAPQYPTRQDSFFLRVGMIQGAAQQLQKSYVRTQKQTGIMQTPETLTSRAIVLNFMDMMKQFLSALREVFPECPKVMGYDVAFTLKTSGMTPVQMEVLGEEAMCAYHEVMSPWYTRCTRRDESLLREQNEFLFELDLPAKWNAGMHPDTKSAIWEYINQLNNFCCLMSWTRDVVPPNIMTAITTNASEMAEKIKSGEMRMSDFNVMDLSQKIMGSVDPHEL